MGRFFEAIWEGICKIASFIVRYFYVYIPVLVMAGFAIFWIFNPAGPDMECYTTFHLLDYWDYNWNMTVGAWEWLEATEESFFMLAIILFKFLVVVLAAIIELVFIYFIFGCILSLICVLFYFIINIVIWFILPAAAVVYSIIITAKCSEYEDRAFFVLCTILTLAATVICYLFAFPAAFG